MKQKFVVLLRAVNVSGKNLLKMADLKSKLLEEGFEDVQTYIQSGNIVLSNALSSKEIENSINKLIQTNFQLDIDVFVFTEQEFKTIIAESPYTDASEGNKIFITVLKDLPAQENIDRLAQVDKKNDEYALKDQILYSYLKEGMSNTKLTNPLFESKLKTRSTGRNLNTYLKLQTLLNP